MYHTKNRIVAVDIVRLLAAFAVMLGHLRAEFPITGDAALPKLVAGFLPGSFGMPSALFFVLAGFFACRNNSWKKALDNAWWCFAPYVLWNAIAWGVLLIRSAHAGSFADIFGFWPFFLPSEAWGTTYHGALPNAPLWFMRDLIFLFLLSPIIGRYARYIFPALVVISVIPECAAYFSHDHAIGICMSPYSMSFFAAGCFLASFSKDKRDVFLAYHSVTLLAAYLVIRLIIIKVLHWDMSAFLGNLCSVWMLYLLSRCVEVYIPRATPLALKYAPITFLTFAFHGIIYPLFTFRDSYTPLLLPVFVFILMTAFFFSMKRWCRPLLHLVAHYKLRPDDFAPNERRNT